MDAATTGCDEVLPAEAGRPSEDQPIGLLTSHFEQFYARVYGHLLHRLFDRVSGVLRYTLADGRVVGIVELVPKEAMTPDGNPVAVPKTRPATSP
jgi:hypothetical protein